MPRLSKSDEQILLAITVMRDRLDKIERMVREGRGAPAAVVARTAKKRPKRKTARKVAKKKARLSAKGRSDAAKRREAAKRVKRRGGRQIDLEDLIRADKRKTRNARAR